MVKLDEGGVSGANCLRRFKYMDMRDVITSLMNIF